jgi:hypothetical protein
MKKILNQPHKQILYDVEWQILRTQLLAKNNATGGWASVFGASCNVQRLKNYLGQKPTLAKVWRVLNLLDAVRMGYSGQQRTGSFLDNQVKKEREKLSKLYKDMISQYSFEIPSEEETIRDITKAPEEDLKKVYVDLYSRWSKHRTSTYRGELRRFLDLIEEHRFEVVF